MVLVQVDNRISLWSLSYNTPKTQGYFLYDNSLVRKHLPSDQLVETIAYALTNRQISHNQRTPYASWHFMSSTQNGKQ